MLVGGRYLVRARASSQHPPYSFRATVGRGPRSGVPTSGSWSPVPCDINVLPRRMHITVCDVSQVRRTPLAIRLSRVRSGSYLLRTEGHKPVPCETVSALRFRHMDGEDVSCHPVREVRGRHHLPLPKRRRGASAMECPGSPFCGLQAGSTSAEDEARLL